MFTLLILDEHLLAGIPSPAHSSGSARGRISQSIMQAEPDVKAGQGWASLCPSPPDKGLSSGPVLKKEVSETIILIGQ